LPYCTSCGKEIPTEAQYCPFCGKPENVPAQSVIVHANPPDTSGVSNAGFSLLDAKDIVMKKKIMSMREHYDFEDPTGRKLGEGGGNFFQAPAKFVVLSIPDSLGNPGQEVMHIDGKLISLDTSSSSTTQVEISWVA
jgi:zinc-ribbon domain